MIYSEYFFLEFLPSVCFFFRHLQVHTWDSDADDDGDEWGKPQGRCKF